MKLFPALLRNFGAKPQAASLRPALAACGGGERLGCVKLVIVILTKAQYIINGNQ